MLRCVVCVEYHVDMSTSFCHYPRVQSLTSHSTHASVHLHIHQGPTTALLNKTTIVDLQEFHHAVAEEVRGPFSRGAPPFHESPGAGRGRGGSRDREFPRGGVVGGQGGDGRRAPPPIPHDPAINPRGIEAVVKLRGLPFEATPADVTRWINDKVRSREAFLSVPVRFYHTTTPDVRSLFCPSVLCNETA